MICGSVLVRAGGEVVGYCLRSIFGKEGSINVRFAKNFSGFKISTGATPYSNTSPFSFLLVKWSAKRRGATRHFKTSSTWDEDDTSPLACGAFSAPAHNDLLS